MSKESNESETCPNIADESSNSADSVQADDGCNFDPLAVSNGDHCDFSNQQKKGKSGKKSQKGNQKSATTDQILNDPTKTKKSGTMNKSGEDRIRDILISPDSTVDETVDQILTESIESAVTQSSLGSVDCPFDGSISISPGSDGSKGRRSSSLSSQPVTDHPLKMANEPVKLVKDNIRLSVDVNVKPFAVDNDRRTCEAVFLSAPKPRSLRGSIISSEENSRPASVNSRKSLTGVDIDDPLPSGFGTVSKDCSEEDLKGWSEVLNEWKSPFNDCSQRPPQLAELVSRGIPEALRGQVWQLLANCLNHDTLLNQYNELVSKTCKDEAYILRDVSRTYPAHEYFKDPSSLGQESLYRVCKAYANYDTEIGYCQGMSFVTASLLLHMPEEEAFCLLVHIMSDPTSESNGTNKSNGINKTSAIHGYGHRNLFKGGFDQLHLRFYQLDCLIRDDLPDLSDHFSAIGIESHMYASQWFLTLFTAKFPLFASFYILDLYLLEGVNTLFQVSLSLLQLSKEELLKSDFEGVLRYFRVILPKKFSTMDSAKVLLEYAVNTKVSTATLKKYEKSFSVDTYVSGQGNGGQQGIVVGGQEMVKRFQMENKRLVYSNMRLEQENDDLARELVSSKITLRKQLDALEDVNDALRKEVKNLISANCELEEDGKRLIDEVTLLKENFRSEVDKSEKEIARNLKIIHDYKSITSQLSQRLENESDKHKQLIDELVGCVKDCSTCYSKVVGCKRNYENNYNGPDSPDGINDQSGDNRIDNRRTRNVDSNNDSGSIDAKVRELELELAQTKLALVEAECVNQVCL